MPADIIAGCWQHTCVSSDSLSTCVQWQADRLTHSQASLSQQQAPETANEAHEPDVGT